MENNSEVPTESDAIEVETVLKKESFFNNKKKTFIIAAVLLVVAVLIYAYLPYIGPKVDDWEYNYSASEFGDILDEIGRSEIGLAIAIFIGLFVFSCFLVIIAKRMLSRGKESKLKLFFGKLFLVIGRFFLLLYLVIFSIVFYGVIFYLMYPLMENFSHNKILDGFLGDMDTKQSIGVAVKVFVSGISFVMFIFLGLGIAWKIKAKREGVVKKIYNNIIIFSVIQIIIIIALLFLSQFVLDSVFRTATLSNYSSSGFTSGSSSFGFESVSVTSSNSSPRVASDSMKMNKNIGFSVGGAKDINNFRKNIENNKLPIPTDISYEGLFYDYYFDTGQQEKCEKLFCPSYSYAVSKDPFSSEEEYYLSVGLNSGIKESDFERKRLNLVVVLDISGSMGSTFNKYYYDQFGKNDSNKEVEVDEDENKTKMEIAAKSVVGLIDNLKKDDRFGMVLFDDSAYSAKPLNLVGQTDMQSIKDHVLEINDRGGTNMSEGMKAGTNLFEEYLDSDKGVYENRIIFLTDAMPNLGDTSENSLMGMFARNADSGIYTSFIGIGIDFNTELVEKISKVRGANYYSVHSASEFKNRMDDEFEFMVTPLVFDLVLKLEATGYTIEKVYGSPEADELTGEIMKVNTLFPSKSVGGETKGGLVLLKLKKTKPNAQLKLITSYRDRKEVLGGDESVIIFNKSAEYFANTGIEKGVLLSRYTNMIKSWIYEERANTQKPEPIPYIIDWEVGIVDITPERYQLGRWERQSSPLKVSEHYGELFLEFRDYFDKEIDIIGDDELKQELDVLDSLIRIAEVHEDDVLMDDSILFEKK